MPPRAKDAALVMLVLVNVVLLCVVLAQVFQLPQAHAQAADAHAAPRFLSVSGQIQRGFDALYVIDVNQQQLFTWTPARGSSPTNMVFRGSRDLREDFAKQARPAVPPRPR